MPHTCDDILAELEEEPVSDYTREIRRRYEENWLREVEAERKRQKASQ